MNPSQTESSVPSYNSRLDEISGVADIYKTYECSDETINWWCGGCGNFAIQNALKRALALQGIPREKALFCFDVGCNGNGSDKIEGYTIHGLHGRVLPLAAGAKLGNKDMVVIASAGDGATLSEGVNHLIHTIRNDYPIIFLHHDNQNYALTTGQASARTQKGCKRNATPRGTTQEPIDTLSLVMGADPTFVARTLSADVNHMTETFIKALKHNGFAFIDIAQNCPTYNKEVNNQWYLDHVMEVDTFSDYEVSNPKSIQNVVEKNREKIPIGLLYHNPRKQDIWADFPWLETEKSLAHKVKKHNVSGLIASL